MNQPTLTTERLILRPFNQSDAQGVQRLAGNCAVADTTLNIPHPYPDGLAEEWISKHQDFFEEGKAVIFAITIKSSGLFIGDISLMGITKDNQADLGYWIGEPFWNQGFCTEAGKAMVEYGLGEFNLDKINACHLKRNPASGQVMAKIGMTHEGCRQHHAQKWSKFEDVELYGIKNNAIVTHTKFITNERP